MNKAVYTLSILLLVSSFNERPRSLLQGIVPSKRSCAEDLATCLCLQQSPDSKRGDEAVAYPTQGSGYLSRANQSKEHPEKCDLACQSCATSVKKAIDYLDKNLFSLTNMGSPFRPTTYAAAGLAYVLATDAKLCAKKDAIDKTKAYLEEYINETAERLKKGNIPETMTTIYFWSQYVWPTSVTGLFFSELKLRGYSNVQGSLDKIAYILEESKIEGAWGHHKPKKLSQGGYPNTLLISTGMATFTLALLKNKLKMKIKATDDIHDFFKKHQLKDGNFPYDPKQKLAGKDSVGRTSAILLALYLLGTEAKDPVLTKSANYVRNNIDNISNTHGCPTLGVLYGSMACYVLGTEEFGKFKGIYLDKLT